MDRVTLWMLSGICRPHAMLAAALPQKRRAASEARVLDPMSEGVRSASPRAVDRRRLSSVGKLVDGGPG